MARKKTHPLDGPRRKLKRAERHLNELQGGITQWLARDPYEFVQESDPEAGTHVLHCRVTEPFDEEWPLLVGEAMGQTRSALDHLVQQLVLANGRKPSGSHQFPIYKTQEGFKPERIRGIAPRWKTEIRALQPYNADPFEASPLFRLNALTQVDKHRDILVTAVTLRAPGPSFQFAMDISDHNGIAPGQMRMIVHNFLGQPVDGAPIQGIQLDPFDPDVRLHIDDGFRFPLAVAFGERHETPADLHDLVGIVRRIIARFEPAFQ
jgi:hypothetical protein